MFKVPTLSIKTSSNIVENKLNKICMLVSSNVIDDPRVRKAAIIASENSFVVIAIGRHERKRETDYLKIKSYTIDSIKVYKKKEVLLSKLWERFYFSLVMLKKCYYHKPNIIHANDLDTLPIAYLASLLTKSKLVFDAHEIYTENGMVIKYPFLQKILKLIEKFLISKCNWFICVSYSAAKKYSEMYMIKEPLVITNCPFKYKEEILSKNEIFEVLSHGIFVPDRGYEELLKSQKYLDEKKIRIKLRGKGDYKSKLEEIAVAERIPYKVFENPVHVSEVVRAATKSHIGVVLTKPISINYSLTISNKIFEYINAGLPVIMSDLPEHRILNEKYNFGIIVSEVTPMAISKEILNLFNDQKLYNNLKSNAIEASNILNWEIESKKLLDVYANSIS
jgi:glycosyltransferase involved in cell wall biosynthesis